MPRSDRGRRVRFDPQCAAFSVIAATYRTALVQAEKLWRRVQKPRVAKSGPLAERLRCDLDVAEAALEAARAALLAHTRNMTVRPYTRPARPERRAPQAEPVTGGAA